MTLTGGPATGLAFAPLFEQAGVVGASAIAIAAAMAASSSEGWSAVRWHLPYPRGMHPDAAPRARRRPSRSRS